MKSQTFDRITRIMPLLFLCLWLLVSVLQSAVLAKTQSALNVQQTPQEIDRIVVYVDTFPPYINTATAPLGTSATTLKVLGEYADLEVEYRYIPYSDSMKLMLKGKKVASFPYFFTEERAKKYYFSKPIVNISIQLFFNRQFANLTNKKNLQNLRIGTVTGYSYGQNIDKLIGTAKEFDTDMAALTALLSNEIDILPMATGVMESLLSQHFTDQRELIRPIQDIKGTEQFHLMAPKTPFGLAIIEKINRAIEEKFDKTTFRDNSTEKAPKADVAELIPAEGFLAIIGQVVGNLNTTYTLPIGTKVVVLDWSEAIENPNTISSINRNMLLTSKVVVLNGPHVGKELMVRNMHIKLN